MSTIFEAPPKEAKQKLELPSIEEMEESYDKASDFSKPKIIEDAEQALRELHNVWQEYMESEENQEEKFKKANKINKTLFKLEEFLKHTKKNPPQILKYKER